MMENSFLQISKLPESFHLCPRLKVLRFEENCVPLSGVPEKLLSDSKVSLLAFDGNLFDQKSFQGWPGYDAVSCLVFQIDFISY